jgi:hypothetical protein
MVIKQVITQDDVVFLFTDNPEKDIITLVEQYNNRDCVESSIPLGYETPELTDYTFWGNKYKCILLWFDNEDIPNFNTFIK